MIFLLLLLQLRFTYYDLGITHLLFSNTMSELFIKKFTARTFGIVILCLTLSTLSGQENRRPLEEKPPLKDRLFFGGYFGLQFGTMTLIDVSPFVGLNVSKNFAVGLGLTYQYYREKYSGYRYSTNVFGGRAFARYYVIQNIFGQAEYEILNFEPYIEPERVNVHGILLGGGYRQMIGEKSFVSIVVLWNLNESTYSPYSNPVIRMGFGVGL